MQYACEIVPSKYAFVEMVDSNKIGAAQAPPYNIQFDPEGMVVRFPPNYYGLHWEDAVVALRFDGIVPTTVMMSLKLLENGKVREERPVGRIEASCWKQVTDFINEYVQKGGVKVRLEEIGPPSPRTHFNRRLSPEPRQG